MIAPDPNPGGVHQVDRHAADLHEFFHGIPSRPGNIGHDCPLLHQQRVEKGTLAHVRLANDGRPQTVFQCPADESGP